MKIVRIGKTFLLVLLFLFFTSITVSATSPSDLTDTLADIFEGLIDENEGLTSFRSLYIPSGGKSEAMGSSFTALANDIGFFEYNPAASCQLEETELAVFHNSWISDSALETIAYTQRIGNLGYGASLRCFYVPFTEYNIFGDRVSNGYYSETVGTLNVSYNFLAGYVFKGICVGANVKTGYRSVPDYSDDDTDEVITDSGSTQSALAFMGDTGILLRFNVLKFYSARDPNFKFGLTVHNLGVIFTNFTEEIDTSESLPSYISTGISYSFIRPVTITFEFQQPFNISDLSSSESWSAGTGTSVVITPFFSMLGGFQLRGGSPRFTMGAELSVSEIIFNINYTLDMTTSTTPINRISVTAKMELGDGGRYDLQTKIDNLYSTGLHLYADGKLEEAIDVWSQILDYSPHYDPAIAGIESARASIELEERIKEIQQLD